MQVANYIHQYAPEHHRVLCDVGSDHAYLPTFLLLKEQIDFAIAGEVVEGPYKAAQKMNVVYSLGDRLSVRFGDGLSVIQPKDEVNIISICGMGGSLIRDILNKGQDNIAPNTLLILQPNMASNHVRQWINDHRSSIIDEIVLKDHHHYYEIIVAIYQQEGRPLNEQEILFGPINLYERNEAFIAYWMNERNKLNHIQQQMAQATQIDTIKQQWIEQKLKYIQEVLSNDC